MRLMLFSLSVLSGFTLLVNVLAPLTRRWREEVAAFDETMRAARARQSTAPPANPRPLKVTAPPEPNPVPPVPDDERVGFFFRALINGSGALGLCFVPVLFAFVVANTSLMAEAFEVLLDSPATVLGQLRLFGFTFEVANFQLYGLGLSAALILLGGAYAAAAEARSPARWFVLAGALGPLVLFETAVSAQLGWVLASEDASTRLSPLTLAFDNALRGYLCAVTEAVAGFFVVDRLLIPLLRGTAWSIVAPFRALRRMPIAVRTPAPRSYVEVPKPIAALPDPGFVKRLGAAVDEAWFQPLRDLDAHVASFLKRLRKAPAQLAEVSRA